MKHDVLVGHILLLKQQTSAANHAMPGQHHFEIKILRLLRFMYLEQLATSILGPTHSDPPHRGAGLLQERDRHRQALVFSPPSSWAHACHGDHGAKLPSWVRFRSWKIQTRQFTNSLVSNPVQDERHVLLET